MMLNFDIKKIVISSKRTRVYEIEIDKLINKMCDLGIYNENNKENNDENNNENNN